MKVLPARDARPDDAEVLVAMIRELAVFEKLEHLVCVTPDALRAQLVGPRPSAYALVVEAVDDDASAAREAVAFALYFHNFSTFLGKPGLYLEDLYVRPAWRGQGIGKGLLAHLARIAVARGCGRFEWSVLDWNTRAIDVYRGIGAQLLDDWRICRVTGEALERLGAAGQV
jgi:GNAT superfamily N-acetyltransferase